MVWGTLFAFAAALVLTPVVVRAFDRLRILDYPNERSAHDRPVVRGGGVAPAFACTLAGAYALSGEGRTATGILVVSALFGLLGLAEDLKGIHPIHRLGLQFAAAAAASPWLLEDLGGPLWWRVIFAAGVVLWIVAYANAFNFMDGIDGISVAQIVVAGATWAIIGWSQEADPLAVSGAIVAAAAVAFLPFNFPRARVFLGDVGSYFLGAWLAATLVMGFRAGIPPEAVLAPLALYLADTSITIVQRIADGEVFHSPHQRHTYQRLIKRGWSHPATTGLVTVFLLVTSALGLVSLTGSVPLRVAADAAIVATLVVYLSVPAWVERWVRVRTAAA